MAHQANILSFDEARRASGAPRPAASSSRKSARSRAAAPAAPARSERPARTRARARSASASAAAPAPRASVPPSSRAALRFDAAAYSSAPAASRRAANRSDAAPRLAGSRRLSEEPRDLPSDEDEASTQKPSRFAAFKRDRAKTKADRAFTRQFGRSDAPSGAAESGPRAAVYKGEMGAAHRRSARMQDGASEHGASKKRRATGFFSSLKSSPKFIASAAVAACLVLSCTFLYPAAQQYYQAVREHDRLEAEYAAVEQRNAAIQNEVDSLQTGEGVKARAHEQFGWVGEGEQTATVRGIDVDEGSSSFLANITPGSVQAPETWYSPVLDVLFGVE